MDFVTYPDYVCEFGGRIEKGESVNEALVRELNEELGAKVDIKDVVSFGSVTEAASNYSDLINCFFWHDQLGSITGCYEGEARYFNHASQILELPKITESLRWLLAKCQNQGLIKYGNS